MTCNLQFFFFGGIDTSVSVLCILGFQGGVRGWGFGFWWLQTSLHWIWKGPPSLLRNNILNALTGLSTITTSQDAHNFCRFSSSSGPVAHLHHILDEDLTIPWWKTPTTKSQTQCDDLLRTIVYIHIYIYMEYHIYIHIHHISPYYVLIITANVAKAPVMKDNGIAAFQYLSSRFLSFFTFGSL